MNRKPPEPKISVILPVYNAGKYLRKAMESVLAQTFIHFELIAINDGSTDDSADILASCLDERLRVINNPSRLKLSGALNRGMEEAQCEYVARMDADDLAHPDRFRRQLDYLDAHPDVGIIGTWVRTIGGTESVQMAYPEKPGDVHAFSFFNCPFAHPTVMFRRELFMDKDLKYDGSFYPTEDFELWSRALQVTRGANLPGELLNYRVHAASMTQSDWTSMDAQAARILANLLQHLGLPCSKEDGVYHRHVAMARGAGDKEALQKIEAWLIRFKEAAVKAFPEDAASFDFVIAQTWFRNVMASTKIGPFAETCFKESVLSKADPKLRKHTWTVKGSVFKNRLKGA